MNPVHCAYCGKITGYRALEGGNASFGGLCNPLCPESSAMDDQTTAKPVFIGAKADAWALWNGVLQ